MSDCEKVPEDTGPDFPAPEGVIRVGRFNKNPQEDEPYFLQVSEKPDGSLVLGPFKLSAEVFNRFMACTSLAELEGLVQDGELRSSTLSMLQEAGRFTSALELLSQGSRPSEQLIRNCFPGDLQRVVAHKMLGI